MIPFTPSKTKTSSSNENNSNAAAAPSPSSPASASNSSPHRQLSPRQRRLLQASARARAAAAARKNNNATDDRGASVADGGGEGPSSPTSFMAPSSPASASVSPASASAAAAYSPASITPTELKLKVPLSPIRCSSPYKPSVYEFSTPTHQRGNNGGNGGGGNTANCSSATGSGSGASTAVLTEATTASIENGIRRLQLKNKPSSVVNVNHKLKSAKNNNNVAVGANVNNTNDVAAVEGGEVIKAMRGKVSDRIRAFSNNQSTVTNSNNGNAGSIMKRDNLSHIQSSNQSNINNSNGRTIGESIQGEDAKRGPLHEQLAEEEEEEERMVYHPPKHQLSSRHNGIKLQKANSPHIRKQSVQYSSSSQRYPSDEINGDGDLRYYRITFKGVVSLLADLDSLDEDYDEEMQSLEHATTNISPFKNIHSNHNNIANNSNNGGNISSGKYYVGYGEIIATSSPEIIIPLQKKTSSSVGIHNSEKQAFVRAIRVDSILTGGYAADAHAASINGAGCGISYTHNNWSMDESFTENQNYGYLLLSSQNDSNTNIAEPIPSSKSESLQSSCEHGPFLYRVSASSPVSILSGPAMDAVTLGMGLLPGTLHDVSLRISIPISPENDNDDDDRTNSGFDDTLIDEADPANFIQYLRLGQRRGWVADRRVDVVKDQVLRVSYLMQDVTTNEDTLASINSRGGGLDRLIDASLSMSFEGIGDASSLNSSAMNSTMTNASFYSSVVASSVATPTAVKNRRRRNRRRSSRALLGERTQQLTTALPTLVRDNQRMFGESFEETGSSITGGGTGGDGSTVSYDEDSSSVQFQLHTSATQNQRQRPTKSYYLMRVIAPLGLKILDAPHFQVSNLIHSPSPHKINNPRSSPTSPGISPFARTNAMIGSAENSPTMSIAKGGRKRYNNSPRVRFLARGQIFEASQREEMTDDSSLYTNGQGLIKLADGSGWAIVPHRDDLMAQFKNYHGGGDHVHEMAAYEEIGNAVIPLVGHPRSQHLHNNRLTPPKHQMQENTSPGRSAKEVVWLRIAGPPNGIKVLLPPPQRQVNKKEAQTTPPPNNKHNRDVQYKMHASTSHDLSEVASSAVSSSFFDSVWSRVTTTPTKEKESREHHHSSSNIAGATSTSLGQQQLQQPMIPVIPCGMVVPVEPLDPSIGSNKKCFSRLYNGQGWIPRSLGDALYAYEVDTPDIRVGSFWFRVKSRSGLHVRHGPSSNAPIIKSDDHDASFRFECGEFLRASEIMTVFNKTQSDALDDGASATSECFAKLYRRRNHPIGENNDSSQNLLGQFSSLQSLTSPGEWVQVHGNGDLLLEECSAAPIIERSRDGWRYTMIGAAGVGLRVHSGPSLEATQLQNTIWEEDFLVSERVTADDGDQGGAAWLRLKSGGWVHSVGGDGKAVVRAVISVPMDQGNNEHSHRMVRQILEKGSRATLH